MANRRRAAVVTGGSTGIGAAICDALIDGGHEVVSLDRQAPARPAHERLHSVMVDLSDTEATRRAAADVVQGFEVGHLVHNAGVIRPNLIDAAEAEDIEALASLHLAAPLVLLKAFLPDLKSRRQGRVVLVSSRAALGVATRTAYAATKAGMIGMARTWALELAPHGVTVNVVAPGPIGSTAMFETLVPPGSATEAAVSRSIPIGRLGRPEDVANAVLFFSRPESGFVTGQVLYVCGGASVGLAPI
jgi:3-oxoacyl-[acyl-carrier protein] reductase